MTEVAIFFLVYFATHFAKFVYPRIPMYMGVYIIYHLAGVVFNR